MFSVETAMFIELSTIAIFVLTVVLAAFITKAYARTRKLSSFFWGLGLWLFALGVMLETFFAAGIYNNVLIMIYLFIVALLVNMLAFGSMQLVAYKRVQMGYYAYSLITLAVLVYSLVSSNIGNVLITHVVAGPLPISIIIASSLVTFPAAVVLVWTAAASYLKTKNKKMISIILGVIVVSIAGGLYIAAFPAFLYYSEFIGIVLLWFGFFSFGEKKSNIKKTRQHKK
jgi:hypothetical protein